MFDGILLVDKEKGVTSYDVIRKLKKILPKDQKIGHSGTLDPFATGLLVILLGKGTKLNDSLQKLKKGYEVRAEFGYETDTMDSTGEVIERCGKLPKFTSKDIEGPLALFVGPIAQIPPKYSAKRVKGERAYSLARKGIKFFLEPKKINVYSFEIKKFNWPVVTFEIVCSSGTYVRKLIADLGRKIGVYGNSVDLRRLFVGDFKVENAFLVKSITEDNIGSKIIDLEKFTFSN
ncbi:tRNA pseudouridine(55) synthase TruB [Candidatus Dojkabacteria bacterium]|nr:tRNA pseudouridine(55) synthase TruB [Candidatus Dojkabacteria bacterium]